MRSPGLGSSNYHHHHCRHHQVWDGPVGLVHARLNCRSGPQLRLWGGADPGTFFFIGTDFFLAQTQVIPIKLKITDNQLFCRQVILQPQSPLTNPGRLTKKHKAEEEEVEFNFGKHGGFAQNDVHDNRMMRQ